MGSWQKNGLWGAILLTGGLAAAHAAADCAPFQAREVRIGTQSWRVDVAQHAMERERGLSGRDHLAVGEGMWFVLPEPGLPGFWMQGMQFAIDLVWVTPEARVAGIVTLAPCGKGPCPISFPPQVVNYVLEVPAGSVQARTGEAVRWLCPADAP